MHVDTTRAQFKAALANEAARIRIGISMSDQQALVVLADDAQVDAWYEWWSRRPAGAVAAGRADEQDAHARRTDAPARSRQPRSSRTWVWVTLVITSVPLLVLFISAAVQGLLGVWDVILLLVFWDVAAVSVVAGIRFLVRVIRGG